MRSKVWSKASSVLVQCHNQIQNITARLLKEVCKDICVELQLQQLTSETLLSSTLTGTEVRLDICARGFWQTGQMVFLNVRIFNDVAQNRYVKQDNEK